MPKKGQKKLRGQPELYDEVKGQVNLSLTKTGTQGIDELAESIGLSRSEFVEQIGRRLLAVLTPEEAKSVKVALEQLTGSAQDELLGQGLFEGRKAEGDRATLLQQELAQWQQLLSKLGD